MTGRRELAVAAVFGVAGAGLVVGLTGRVWATAAERANGLEPLSQQLTGRSLSAALTALGWAGLAGIAAVPATRSWARVAVGVLLTIFGTVIAISAPFAVRHAHVLAVAGERTNLARLGGGVTVHTNLWWAVCLTGGVLLAAAGLFTVVRGRRWPGMSARYDRPGATAPAGDDPASLWKSLDRGDDPTRSDAGRR